jgi:nucleotide-binding universal stress UspA family protein
MRVLVAVDGSAGAQTAAELIRSMLWPPQTTVRLISVVDPGAWIPPGPGVPGTGGLVSEREVSAYFEREQVAIAGEYGNDGPSIECRMASGRPANVLVDEARRFQADVLATGSRGHGKIASLLLGSVTAEIIERSPCPVLVARRRTLRTALLAVDGSASARAAAQVTASWESFADVPLTIIAVAEAPRPWTVGIAPGFHEQAHAEHARDVHDATIEARSIAEEAVDGLQTAGRRAMAEVRHGQPAAEILAAAGELDTDMAILGSRGRTGLKRILLGSVARDVLLATDASVLVVRVKPAKAR